MRDSAVSNSNNRSSSDVCDMKRSCEKNVSNFKLSPTNNHIYDDGNKSSFAFVLTEPARADAAVKRNLPRPVDWELVDQHSNVSPANYCSELNISVRPSGGSDFSGLSQQRSPPKKMTSAVKVKSRGENFHSNLIDFGTPPSSPLRSNNFPTDNELPTPYYYPGPGLA